MRRIIALAAFLMTSLTSCLVADDYEAVSEITRNKTPGSTFPIAQSIQVPAGADIIFMSGTVPQTINADAEPGSRAAYGDTEAQTVSAMTELQKRLQRIGLDMGDIVMMRAYLVADPEMDNKMDFAGFMRGYTQFFGTEAQPNLPSRSAIQIAGLARPTWLVEIEVVAAKDPAK